MSSTTALPTPTPNKSALLPDSKVGKVVQKSVQSTSTRRSKKRQVEEALAIETPLDACKPAVDTQSFGSLGGSSLDNEIANMPVAEDYHCDLLNKEPPMKVSASFSALMSQGTSKSTLKELDDVIAEEFPPVMDAIPISKVPIPSQNCPEVIQKQKKTGKEKKVQKTPQAKPENTPMRKSNRAVVAVGAVYAEEFPSDDEM